VAVNVGLNILRCYCGIRICQLRSLHVDVVAKLSLESALMDHCGDYIGTVMPHLLTLLYKALGPRVRLIAAKPTPDAVVNI